MNAYIKLSASNLQEEMKRLKKASHDKDETVFMRMLHEIQLHQVELEVQNRALREAQIELKETRDRYASLYDSAPLAYFTFDRDGVILEANLAGSVLLGMKLPSLIGMSFVNFVAREDRQKFIQQLHFSMSGKSMAGTELTLDLPLNKFISVQIASIPDADIRKGSSYCRVALIDVTDRKLAELKLRMASKALENAHEGIMLTDSNKKIVAVNPAFSNKSGYSAEDIVGHSPSILKSTRHNNEFYQDMNSAFESQDGWQGEIWNRHKNGEIYPELLNIKVIRNENGDVDCYVAIFSDISNQDEMKSHLYELAYYDILTGLSNRSLLYDRLQQQIFQSKRNGSIIAIAFIDLDKFKYINDTYGHIVGDQVLKSASDRLLSCIRDGDTLSRIGGDEFVAILKDIENEDVAGQVASRMVHSMNAAFDIDGDEMFVTSSVGISVYPKDGEEVAVLLKNADSAMYYAKQQGRNCYKYYQSSMNPFL